MSNFGGPRLIPTVAGGSSRPNRTSSVKKSKFSKLLLKPFCQITAEMVCLIGFNFEWSLTVNDASIVNVICQQNAICK